MKIISLNAWCGRGKGLNNFFEKNKDVDIFCLQEVDLDGTKFGPEITHSNENEKLAGDPFLFETIQKILPNHHGYFSPQLSSWWGNAIFVKKDIYRSIAAYGELVVSDMQQQYVTYQTWFRRTIHWFDYDCGDKKYTIINFHGLWEKGKGKKDSFDRLDQSLAIRKFLYTKINRLIIFVGDFNLNPTTKSLQILEDLPLRNLITDYGVKSTRTHLYKKESRFADYMLVNPEIVVKDFKVLPDVISDHAPLYLEIE